MGETDTAEREPLSVRLVRGKADFVKRVLPSGQVEDVCLCEWNADFSTRGCIAQVRADRLQEVFDNGGSYAPGNLQKYQKMGDCDNRCDYCYANRKNAGNIGRRVVDEKTRNDFETERPKVVRIGKTTEVGHPYYFPVLDPFFDLAKEFESYIIFTAKMFPFGIEGAEQTMRFAQNGNRTTFDEAIRVNMPSGKDLAEKMKGRVSLLYSMGWDKMEGGPVSQGFNNEWRIEQARQYHEAGANVSLTVVCDVTHSIERNIELGSGIGMSLLAKRAHGVNIRILPIRIGSEKVAQAATGMSMKSLKDNGFHRTLELKGRDGLPMICGGETYESGAPYESRGNHEIVASRMHPDFRKLIEKEKLGVCGSIGETEYCDQCVIHPKPARIHFPKSQLPKINFTKQFSKRPNAKERGARGQPRFDFKKKTESASQE